MSNVPLPEPHHQSAANFNAPDEPFYTADQMHAHAAAVSAADNKALREALERDALRYRWLRDNGLQIRTRQFKRKTWYAVGNIAQQEYDYHSTLDCAIDAAMKEQP